MRQGSKQLRRRWWLIALTIALALMQIDAIIRLLNTPDALTEQISLVLPLEIFAGGLWTLIFAVLAVNLLRSRTTRLAQWTFIGFATYSTVRLLLFAQADYDQNRLPFLVTANSLAWLLAFILRR